MSLAPEPLSESNSPETPLEALQAPLGLSNPLGTSTAQALGSTASLLQFRRPLGARSLSVLDPSIFISEARSPIADAIQPFREFPFFESEAFEPSGTSAIAVPANQTVSLSGSNATTTTSIEAKAKETTSRPAAPIANSRQQIAPASRSIIQPQPLESVPRDLAVNDAISPDFPEALIPETLPSRAPTPEPFVTESGPSETPTAAPASSDGEAGAADPQLARHLPQATQPSLLQRTELQSPNSQSSDSQPLNSPDGVQTSNTIVDDLLISEPPLSEPPQIPAEPALSQSTTAAAENQRSTKDAAIAAVTPADAAIALKTEASIGKDVIAEDRSGENLVVERPAAENAEAPVEPNTQVKSPHANAEVASDALPVQRFVQHQVVATSDAPNPEAIDEATHNDNVSDDAEISTGTAHSHSGSSVPSLANTNIANSASPAPGPGAIADSEPISAIEHPVSPSIQPAAASDVTAMAQEAATQTDAAAVPQANLSQVVTSQTDSPQEILSPANPAQVSEPPHPPLIQPAPTLSEREPLVSQPTNSVSEPSPSPSPSPSLSETDIDSGPKSPTVQPALAQSTASQPAINRSVIDQQTNTDSPATEASITDIANNRATTEPSITDSILAYPATESVIPEQPNNAEQIAEIGQASPIHIAANPITETDIDSGPKPPTAQPAISQPTASQPTINRSMIDQQANAPAAGSSIADITDRAATELSITDSTLARSAIESTIAEQPNNAEQTTDVEQSPPAQTAAHPLSETQQQLVPAPPGSVTIQARLADSADSTTSQLESSLDTNSQAVVSPIAPSPVVGDFSTIHSATDNPTATTASAEQTVKVEQVGSIQGGDAQTTKFQNGSLQTTAASVSHPLLQRAETQASGLDALELDASELDAAGAVVEPAVNTSEGSPSVSNVPAVAESTRSLTEASTTAPVTTSDNSISDNSIQLASEADAIANPAPPLPTVSAAPESTTHTALDVAVSNTEPISREASERSPAIIQPKPSQPAGTQSADPWAPAEIPQLPRALQDLTVLSPLSTTASSPLLAAEGSVQRSDAPAAAPSSAASATPASSAPAPPVSSSHSFSNLAPASPGTSSASPFSSKPLAQSSPSVVSLAGPAADSTAGPAADSTTAPANWSSIEDLLIQTETMPAVLQPKPSSDSLPDRAFDSPSNTQASSPAAAASKTEPASFPSIQTSADPSPASSLIAASVPASPTASTSSNRTLPSSRVLATETRSAEAFPNLYPFRNSQSAPAYRSGILQRQAMQQQPETAIASTLSEDASEASPEPAIANESEAGQAGNDDAFEKLAQAIYLQLRQRLATEQERAGRSSSGRFP